MKKLSDIYKKYKEQILYIAFGGGTTLVNIISYWIFDKLSFATAVSTAIAWFLSVAFAYITNKIFVFNSKTSTLASVLKETFYFYVCRLATGVLDLGIMMLFVDVLGFNGLLIKILSNILVIVLNYIFSKLIIFKKQ